MDTIFDLLQIAINGAAFLAISRSRDYYQSVTSGKAGGLKKVEPLKAVRL